MGRTWRGLDRKQRRKYKDYRRNRQSKHHFGSEEPKRPNDKREDDLNDDTEERNEFPE